MFVYTDCINNFHALFHDGDPLNSQTLCGGHTFSTDGGLSWVDTGWTYSNVVQFTDGTKFHLVKEKENI